MIRLVLRNIIRNRKNSLVVFFLVAVITALFFIGNSIIGQTNAGLRKTYVDSLTADVVIQKNSDMSMNLFGANSPVIDNYVTIPTLPVYDQVVEIAAAEKAVASHTSLVSGRALLEMSGISSRDEAVLICGVESESYFDCFPGIELVEGRFLEAGEYGAMITSERADRVEQETGIRPAVGSPMLFTSAGNIGFRIREVPLAGVYRYRNPGQFMNEIVLADPQTVRVLLSVQVATAPADEPAESSGAAPVSTDPFSHLFDSAGTYEDAEGFDPEDLIVRLRSEGSGEAELAGGDWNFLLLRLKEGAAPSLLIKSLNKKLAPYNVYASGWRTAAGTSAIMMLLVQAFFNIGGFLVSIAGIIVVVNILLISVFRRTREIGTLRAIGASDSYVRILILGENGIISFLGGIAGVAGGAFFLGLINSRNITIPNELVASLLGGSTLHIGFLPLTALASFCIALFLGGAASVFPIEMAVRIDPVKAVGRG